MKRALLLCVLLAACSNSPTPVATGEFAGPSGLAVTAAGDRDVLFIANEGRDSLRALQLCTQPADAGTPDSCIPQDSQFIPAPIRVFPANIETGGRPRRLAGVRLTRPDNSRTGVVLAVGADNAVRTVDARNLVEAANRVAPAAPVIVTALDSPAVDVAAENALDGQGLEIGAPAGTAATAFAVTLAHGAVKAQLLMFSVALDANGAAAAPTLTGQCTLDPVVPTRVATVPGGGDRVYVADGAGDGVVVIQKSGIPPPASNAGTCPMDRISAGGRQVSSLAVSPPWFEGTTTHPAGELLMMVLEPRAQSAAAVGLDAGGILFARTADKAIVPVPPFSTFDTTAGLQAMEPIAPPSMAREAAFLRAIPPDPACTAAPCISVYVGYPTQTPVAYFSLAAAVTSTNGSTYFLDVLKRRFISPSYYLGVQIPINDSAPVLSPSSSDPTPPTFTFLAPDSAHPNTGWFTAGVTHQSRWRVVWHGTLPGLETRGGTLAPTDHGTLLLNLPAVNLAAYAADPALLLAPGDVVAFSSYVAPAGAPQSCVDLASQESQSPSRFELTISAFPAADTLELQPLTPTDKVRAFNIAACPGGLGVAAAVRAAGDRPWLVFDGGTARGRAKKDEPFVGTGQRFDYPLDSTAAAPPLVTDNSAVGFVLSGDDPPLPGTNWTFSVAPGVDAQAFRDATVVVAQGFADTVTSYSSTRHPQLIFTSVTGENSVLQADPAFLNSQAPGIIAYK